KTPGHWLSKLSEKKNFVWWQRQVSEEQASPVLNAKLPGIFFEQENTRVYPNGELAANLLGFTDPDGKGISGVAYSLNHELISQGKTISAFRDGKGNLSSIDRSDRNLIPDGVDGVILTVDRRLQYVLEESLESWQEEVRARSLMAVIL